VTNPDHFDGENDTKLAAVEQLSVIADEAGLPLAHLALAWAVEHPAVTTALIGPRTLDQLDGLLGAMDVRLGADVLDAVDEVVPPGLDLNPADVGWTPPSLDPAARRRG
jgi:aryl-alcohol dehydrogenase (NADP+)